MLELLSVNPKTALSSSSNFIVADNIDINPDSLTLDQTQSEQQAKFHSFGDMQVQDHLQSERQAREDRNLHYGMIKDDMLQYKPQILNGKLMDKLDLRPKALQLPKPGELIKTALSDELYQFYKAKGQITSDENDASTNEFDKLNSMSDLTDERRRRLRVHEEILKNKRSNLIKSKLYHKIKRKKGEREQQKEFEANKYDIDYLKNMKEQAEESRVLERFEQRHSHKKKGMFLSNKLKSHSESSNFLKNQISEMNRSSSMIKNKPDLYVIENENEHDDQYYTKEDKDDPNQMFSNDLLDLPFMRKTNKHNTKETTETVENDGESDDGLDDYKIQEKRTKENTSNREFNYEEKHNLKRKRNRNQSTPADVYDAIDAIQSKNKLTFQPKVKSVCKDKVQEVSDFIHNLKTTSRESKMKKLNTDVIREFLVSDACTFSNNVVEDQQKRNIQAIRKEGEDLFKKKAGWGDWCGPEEFDQFRKDNAEDKLAQKSKELMQSQLKKEDFDGYVIRNKGGQLDSKFMVNRVPFPYSIEQYNALMSNNITREANSVSSYEKLNEEKVVKGYGQYIKYNKIKKDQELNY